MREIIFRGKRVDNGEWVYGYVFTLFDRPVIKFGESDKELVGVIPETVGQYTGLTDKNGKKIFEGDIVAIDENSQFESTGKGIVISYNGKYISFYGQDLLGRDCYDDLCNVCKERGIIDNIYDNKLENL